MEKFAWSEGFEVAFDDFPDDADIGFLEVDELNEIGHSGEGEFSFNVTVKGVALFAEADDVDDTIERFKVFFKEETGIDLH
jgi:hypothetical protein